MQARATESTIVYWIRSSPFFLVCLKWFNIQMNECHDSMSIVYYNYNKVFEDSRILWIILYRAYRCDQQMANTINITYYKITLLTILYSCSGAAHCKSRQECSAIILCWYTCINSNPPFGHQYNRKLPAPTETYNCLLFLSLLFQCHIAYAFSAFQLTVLKKRCRHPRWCRMIAH